MSNYFCINKSGLKIPVYSDTKKTKQIGTLYDREAFGYDCNWGGDDYFAVLNSEILPGNYPVDILLILLPRQLPSALIIHMELLKLVKKPF